MHVEYHIEGGNFTRAGLASSESKKLLRQLNVDVQIIKRAVVASYEAEVNVVAHAYNGTLKADIDTEKIVLCFEDQGPGIEDIDLAMKEGYSTASSKVREMGFGAGMGLPNIHSNADELSVSSEDGKGTRVLITLYVNKEEK